MHTSATCESLQCLFMFLLPNVTQPHPFSTCSQTSYQEFSGCLSGSGSWSKLMAEQQSSVYCESYPPIYHTDCRHDVMAGECAATHPTYVSTFLFSSLLPFNPALFSSLLSSCLPLITLPLPFSLFFFRFTPPHSLYISLCLLPALVNHTHEHKHLPRDVCTSTIGGNNPEISALYLVIT